MRPENILVALCVSHLHHDNTTVTPPLTRPSTRGAPPSSQLLLASFPSLGYPPDEIFSWEVFAVRTDIRRNQRSQSSWLSDELPDAAGIVPQAQAALGRTHSVVPGYARPQSSLIAFTAALDSPELTSTFHTVVLSRIWSQVR